MNLRLTNRNAIGYLKLLELIVFLIGGSLIFVTYMDALETTKNVKTQIQQALVSGYNTTKSDQANMKTFDEYKKQKIDSIETSVVNLIPDEGWNRWAYKQYNGWNVLFTFLWFLFIAIGVRVAFRVLKNSFSLQERLDAIESKLSLLINDPNQTQSSQD